MPKVAAEVIERPDDEHVEPTPPAIADEIVEGWSTLLSDAVLKHGPSQNIVTLPGDHLLITLDT